MDHSARQPLSFKSVKGRFCLIEVSFVSYSDGTGFFAVKRDVPQPFPFGPSLRCLIGKHSDEEIIPVPVIENWMERLALTTQEMGTFWAVEDLGDYPIQITLQF
jgi:hypothetical protein